MSRPAPRRHRAARLLALTSGPPPTAEEAVDVRPKPELFSSLLLTQRGRGVRYSHVYFSRFYEPGARLAFARPTTPSKPVRPHGTQLPRSACSTIIPRRRRPRRGRCRRCVEARATAFECADRLEERFQRGSANAIHIPVV